MARIVVIGFGAHQSGRASAALARLNQDGVGADEQPVLATRDALGKLHFRKRADLHKDARGLGGPFGLTSGMAGLLFLSPMMFPVQAFAASAAWYGAWAGHEARRSAKLSGQLG